MNPAGRRAGTLPAVLALVALLTVGCSTPEPKASNAVPPAATAPATAPVVWAVLGGAESAPGGPNETYHDRWIQRVLAKLPPSAQMVNVAANEPAGSILRASAQVDAVRASGSVPTVATVWFPGDDPRLSSELEPALTALVGALKDLGVATVVLLARTDGDKAGTGFVATTERVAAATGARFVPVARYELDPRQPAYATDQQAIADSVLPLLLPAS